MLPRRIRRSSALLLVVCAVALTLGAAGVRAEFGVDSATSFVRGALGGVYDVVSGKEQPVCEPADRGLGVQLRDGAPMRCHLAITLGGVCGSNVEGYSHGHSLARAKFDEIPKQVMFNDREPAAMSPHEFIDRTDFGMSRPQRVAALVAAFQWHFPAPDAAMLENPDAILSLLDQRQIYVTTLEPNFVLIRGDDPLRVAVFDATRQRVVAVELSR